MRKSALHTVQDTDTQRGKYFSHRAAYQRTTGKVPFTPRSIPAHSGESTFHTVQHTGTQREKYFSHRGAYQHTAG